MIRRSILLPLLLILDTVLISCTEPVPVDGTEEEAIARICDGQPVLRLAVTVRVPRPDEEMQWARMLDNGYSYLFVDGTCRFYHLAEPWAPVVSGTIDPESLRTLIRLWHVRSWRYLPPLVVQEGLFDAPLVTFSDGEVFVKYIGFVGDSAGGRGIPELIAQMARTVTMPSFGLPSQGQPVAGATRFKLFAYPGETFTSSTVQCSAWRIRRPIESATRIASPEEANIPAEHVMDHSESAAMREMLAYVKKSAVIFQDFVPVGATDGPCVPDVGLYFRDAIPLEDVDGVVRYSDGTRITP